MKAGLTYSSPFRLWRWLLVLLLALGGGLGVVAGDTSGAVQTLDRALLQSLQGERQVSLPHVLQPADYASAGGRVRYRMDLPLAVVPAEPLGVYVRKLSLSGRLSLNGHELAGCELGPLEDQRCLHQPYLFVPPLSLWRVGANVLEFEIYANGRQMSGLSAVQVGSAQALSHGPFLMHRFLQVESLHGLSWVNLCLGLLALTVAFLLRSEKTYLWFGLASIANALSNLNTLVTSPMVPIELFNWFVFCIRLVSVPLFFLALLGFFESLDKRLERAMLAYAVAIPVIVWLGGSSLGIALALYVPQLLMGIGLLLAMIRWSMRSRHPLQIAVTVNFGLSAIAGLVDVLRLAGQTQFEGVYLVNYVTTGIVLLFGAMLLARLAAALTAERGLSARLDQEVAQRTAELQEANRQLATLAVTDGLTGVANRRHFDDTLTREWQRAERQQQPLAVVLFDVDFFKAYNDHYGHQAGDACLQQVAQALQTCAQRVTDLVARYGGEEFAVIVAADVQHATQLAEHMRVAVEALHLTHRQAPGGRVTVSAGVAACIPTLGSNPGQLLHQADVALYRAKALGRNRVQMANDSA